MLTELLWLPRCKKVNCSRVVVAVKGVERLEFGELLVVFGVLQFVCAYRMPHQTSTNIQKHPQLSAIVRVVKPLLFWNNLPESV
jgi:hypothetical protein